MQPSEPLTPPPLAFGWVGFIAIALALVASGFGFFRVKAKQVRQDQHASLATIGALKSGQIQSWRKERLADTLLTAKSPLLKQGLRPFLRTPAAPLLRSELLELLELTKKSNVYHSAHLVALDGQVLLSTETPVTPLEPATQSALAAARVAHGAVFSDFFEHAGGVTHLDTLAAVRDPEGQPLAILILRSNAKDFLFPMIQDWPLPSYSAETVLTVRRGNEALVPHKLRYEAETAPRWHQPLTRTNYPSVQAVLGQRGLIEGVDYRGQAVLGDVRAIPDSPWFLHCKIDQDEAYSLLHHDALFITIITGSCILLTAAAFAYANRRRQATGFRKLYEAEQTKVEIERFLRISEERLNQTTERLSLAVRAGGVGIWDYDPIHNHLVWDEQMYRLYGIAEHQFAGAYEAWKTGLHPEDMARGDAEIQLALRGERDFDSEFRVLWPDGSSHFIRGLATVQRDASGQPVRMIGTNWDITEEKQAEAALQASAKSLQQAQSLAGLGSYSLEIASGRWTSSDVLNVLLGIDGHHDHSIENWVALLHPDWRATMTRYFAEEVLGQGLPFNKNYQIVRADDGAARWVHGLGELEFDDQGAPIRMHGTIMDITERKVAEEALEQSEQKFRTLFESLTEGVALHELVQDATGRLVDFRLLLVNAAYQALTGVAAATANGRLGSEIYGTEVPPYLDEFARVARGGTPQSFETFFPTLDKYFRISVVSPKHGQFVTLLEDITERTLRAEELKQKNAEMERFTYMISHDLKSPLVTIRTFLGYLEQDLELGKPERVAKDMGFIRDATGKMARLLEDLLEVSRVGQVVNPAVTVSLADLIKEALTGVAGAIATRGVEIKIDAAVLTLTLTGDRPRLEEIWQNLVENAVKYMGEQPSPNIDFGAECVGAETVFFVRDNGLGIDPRFHDKVFGLFEQLDPTSEGTGLGLALVKRIVELYEGRIWLESAGLEQGTCFRFTLPKALKDPSQGARS